MRNINITDIKLDIIYLTIFVIVILTGNLDYAILVGMIWVCSYFSRFNKTVSIVDVNQYFYLIWAFVIIILCFDVSYIFRHIQFKTIELIALGISSFFIGDITASIYNAYKFNLKSHNVTQISAASYNINLVYYWLLLCISVIMTLVNIYLSGYIPLINAFNESNVNYLNFSISGYYGLYLAFIISFGYFNYIFYLYTKKMKYLLIYIFVVLIMIMFLTRQNLIELMCGMVYINIFLKFKKNDFKKDDMMKYSIVVLIVLILFSLLGNFRTKDFNEVSLIKYNLPSVIKWIYSYTAYNVFNLDNLILNLNEPYFDMSSLYSLIPKIFRKEFEHIYYLEVNNFNVSTYLSTIYMDFGKIGVCIYSICFGFLSKLIEIKLKLKNIYESDFMVLLIAANVFIFCNIFSVFSNYYMYLPIVSQIPIAWLMSRFLLIKNTSTT